MMKRLKALTFFLFLVFSDIVYANDYQVQLELAIKGKPESQAYVGKYLYDNFLVSKDTQFLLDSIEWLRMAAIQENVRSQVLLGVLYSQLDPDLNLLLQDTLIINHKEALYWFSKAVENGEIEYSELIGDMYKNGNYGLVRDLNQAVKWWSIAGRHGIVSSQHKLGIFYRNVNYMNNEEIKPDYKMATYWLEQSSLQGHFESQVALAFIYFDEVKNNQNGCKWLNIIKTNSKYDPKVFKTYKCY